MVVSKGKVIKKKPKAIVSRGKIFISFKINLQPASENAFLRSENKSRIEYE